MMFQGIFLCMRRPGEFRRKTYGHFEGFGYIISAIMRNNKNEEKRNDKDQNKICTEPYRQNARG